jgi:chromosomal replication initiation ATPase DnaA
MHVVDSILSHATDVFRCTADELIGRSRKRALVEARQATMWAIRQRYPSLSLETIGTILGGRHYTTVMHALATVEVRARRSATYHRQVQCLLARVSVPSRPASAAVAAVVVPPHRAAVRIRSADACLPQQ